MKLCDILVLLDRYPCKLETKGGHVDRRCKTLIVTTNIHPRDWYDYTNRETQYNALARRFSCIYVFQKKNDFKEAGCYTIQHEVFFDNYYPGDYTLLGPRHFLPWETPFLESAQMEELPSEDSELSD
jgi:hypothetical protein